MKEKLRILSLEAERIRRLNAVKIALNPDETGPVFIVGNNDEGKSTTLDCILMALCGGRIDEPIRRGEDQGEIRIAIGGEEVELTVRKVFKDGQAPRLIVKTADGMTGGQKALDALIGAIGLDPVELSRMDAKAQAQAVQDGLGVDLDDLEDEYSRVYDERRDLNVTIRGDQGALDSFQIDDGTPEEEVHVDELMQELDARRAVNEENGRIRESVGEYERQAEASDKIILDVSQGVEDLESRIAALQSQRQSMLDQIELVTEEKKQILSQLEGAREMVETLQDLDEAEIRSQIEAATSINEAVRAKKARASLAVKLDNAKAKAAELTARLAGIDEAKKTRISEAGLPESLSAIAFTDEGLTYDGFPLAKLGTGKRLRVTTQIVCGMMKARGLGVILIKAGNDLDDGNLRAVIETAEEAGVQVWIESVFKRGGDSPEIEIVDGTAQYGEWTSSEEEGEKSSTPAIEEEIEAGTKAAGEKKSAKQPKEPTAEERIRAEVERRKEEDAKKPLPPAHDLFNK